MILAMPHPEPLFSVGVVLGDSSDQKMLRVDACGTVARVPDAQSVRNRPAMELVGYAVRFEPLAALKFHKTIAGRIKAVGLNPATRFVADSRHDDFSPKLLDVLAARIPLMAEDVAERLPLDVAGPRVGSRRNPRWKSAPALAQHV